MRALTIVAVLLAGCSAVTGVDVEDVAEGDVAGVQFIALGDMGEGSPDQYRVAKAIETVCGQHGCDLVIGLGDNIYPTGVTSSYDPQFVSKFEDPYQDLDLPFYMSLGNHDDGSPAGRDQEAGRHQIMYAQRDDRRSDKWHMPDRYYSFRMDDVRFYALDTPSLMDHRALDDPVHDAQREWLQQTMAQDNATWNIVFGHHPYISNSRYGNAGDYEGVPGRGVGVQNLVEGSVCHRVDMHFAGHAHSLQWLEATDPCGDTEFIISGAGGRSVRGIQDVGNPVHFAQGHTFGFFWISIEGEHLTGRAYDDQARLLYERVLTKSPSVRP